MWPPKPSNDTRFVATGRVLGVDWSTDALRGLGDALTGNPSHASRQLVAMLPRYGIDSSCADALAAAYRLGGTAGLAQAFDAARVKP